MRSKGALDIEEQRLVVLGSGNLVLLQHPPQDQLLAVHRPAEGRLVEFTYAIECGILGGELGQAGEIRRLGHIQLLQIIQAEDAFGGGLDTEYIIAVGTVPERNLI